MPEARLSPSHGGRDLRIDALRGLAMTCVIINHSRMPSLLTWFSYERLWTVTSAEVFVVLSGIVLGMVYGRRLTRDGWPSVMRGLSRRALTLYLAFIAMTFSVLALAFIGINVASVTTSDERAVVWFLDPRNMDASAWRAVMLMRNGPWAFEIVGLYVWLVVAAIPSLFALRFVGWRPLLAVSWALYLLYRIAPHQLTSAEFEMVFPLLSWQILFVHGIVIGFYRDRIGAFLAQSPRILPRIAAGATAAFLAFALCNPWASGPAWMHLGFVSPERFTSLYSLYFGLTGLGIGRLMNLAVALPFGYLGLGWLMRMSHVLQTGLVALGQRSLGAFVLHVYGILVLAHVPRPDDFWTNTFVQIALVASIAAFLKATPRSRINFGTRAPAPERMAA